MTVAFSVHPLLRPGATIPAGLATIIGWMLAADLGTTPCDLRNYRADWLLGPLGCRVTVRGVIIAQLGVVITLGSGSIAPSHRVVSAVGRTIATISNLFPQSVVVPLMTGHLASARPTHGLADNVNLRRRSGR